MIRRSATFLVLTLMALPSWGQRADLYSRGDLQALQEAFVKLAEEVSPSVVAIRTYVLPRSSSPDRRPVPLSLNRGSGFVIGSDGLILSNYHVIEGADAITVYLHDGSDHAAEVVALDERSDLAVIHIDKDHLKPVEWGRLKDVKINQWAFASGNPFGLANGSGRASVTYGVVSGLGRQMTNRLAANNRDRDAKDYSNLIETSAAINPGMSGGPLFDIEGRVIGVVTAIETRSGVSEGHGFAVPIDRNIRHVIDTLKQGKQVRYGFLGIDVRNVARRGNPRMVRGRDPHGAEITDIRIPDGPAAKADLRPRDVIVEFNGVEVRDSDHLIRLVSFTPAGTEAEVTFLRNSVKRKAKVHLGDRFELLELTRD